VTSSLYDRSPIFTGGQVRTLARSDAQHWWFRSKTSVVSTLVKRYAPHGPLVDVGAGSGGVTAQLCPGRAKLAVEGSPELVSICAGRGMPAIVGSASQIPLASASMSVVTMLDVIEHLPDPIAALREARRLLRDDGLLIVTVPAHAWLWSEADELLGHVKRYRRSLLRQELQASGFRALWMSHVFSWLVPPVYVSRRRPSRSAEDQLGLGVDGYPFRIAARALTSAEMLLTRAVPLPVGTSVACAACPA
jgi:SAM-dependent methyltransferase